MTKSEEDALDSMMSYHSSIDDIVLVTPPGVYSTSHIDTKYGPLEVWENPHVPPNTRYLMDKHYSPNPSPFGYWW